MFDTLSMPTDTTSVVILRVVQISPGCRFLRGARVGRPSAQVHVIAGAILRGHICLGARIRGIGLTGVVNS